MSPVRLTRKAASQATKFDELIPGRRRERGAILRRFPGVLYDVAGTMGVSRATDTNVCHRQCSSGRLAHAIVRELLSRMAGNPRPSFQRRAA